VKKIVVSEIDYISNKFLCLPNVQKFEVVSRQEKKFISEIEMEDGYSFRMTGFLLDRVYPGTIVEILNQNEDVSVVVAPYISDRTAAICIDNGIGYFDYSGNCYYVGHSIYLSEKGNKNIVPRKIKTDTIFEKSSVVSSKILRMIFTDINKCWRIKHLSEAVGCSIGQVSKVINYLQENAWIEKTKEGYKLLDPKGLIKEWSSTYGNKETRSFSTYCLNAPAALERKIADMKNEMGIDCYLTGFSGGVRYAPVVRYNKVHVYMFPKDIAEAMDYLSLKEVDSGANVIIYCLDNDSFIKDAKEIDGCKVVSPVQIYLDAMQLKGRGEELAEAVYNKEIRR